MRKLLVVFSVLVMFLFIIGCAGNDKGGVINEKEHFEVMEEEKSDQPEIEALIETDPMEDEAQAQNEEKANAVQEVLLEENTGIELTDGYSEEDIAFISEHTYFRIIEYLGNGQFKCNVSIELAFRKDDVENARIGDTIQSLAGINYEVMEAAREYGSESPLVGEWWSEGLCAEIGIDERNPIVLIDSYYCGRYQINGRAIIENETEKVLTLDPDAIITGYDNNSVSGSDFISYFEGNTDIGLIYSPSGQVKATVNDDVISKMVFIWEG